MARFAVEAGVPLVLARTIFVMSASASRVSASNTGVEYAGTDLGAVATTGPLLVMDVHCRFHRKADAQRVLLQLLRIDLRAL